MRIIKTLIILSLGAVLFTGCEKTENINNTDDRVGISRVVYFPIVTLKGDARIVIQAGGTFTDPGVNAEVGGTTVPYTTAGTVNTATPGVYQLTYTAKNNEGFTASASRIVVVYSTDGSAAGNDFSGVYKRVAPGTANDGVTSTWTKIAPGVYSVLNPGGSATATSAVVIAFNSTGNTIKIPVQPAPDGTPFNSINETYNPGPPATYTWTLINQGYGNAPRNFIKS